MSIETVNVKNSACLIKDLFQGDESIANRNDFNSLNSEDIVNAIQAIMNDYNLSDTQKRVLLTNSWKINYRVKPPSIEEFLTEEWIGQTANELYPHVRALLIEFWNPSSEKRNLILASSIGTGKTFSSTLWSLYITAHLWSMRNTKKFFGLSQASSIVHALISFTMEKAQQLLLQPFMMILQSSPKFRRVKFETKLKDYQLEYPDQVCWTTSGKMGALQFYNDIHYIIASSPENLLGLNMITSIMSEISFFIEKGFSTEYIWRVYQDSKARVRSRFEGKYFSGTVIDSSPNDIELSPIDKYIFQGRAYKDPTNYIVTGAQWEFLPDKFPEWQKTGKSFPVFRGSQGKSAKILEPNEISKFNKDEIYNVPIDVKTLFEENVIKNVKDYCGWPSGSQGVLVRDNSIIERMFNNSLQNVYTSIFAPENANSRHLIWNEIKDQFFVKFDRGYEFYRHPVEKRFIHIDQAEINDMASISMIHPETDKKEGEIIYVADFTLAISPEKGRINLDSIRHFIEDLRDLGHLNIAMISFDQYQSSSAIQYLKDKDFNVVRLSVDRDPKPYYTYISLLSSGKLKTGRNIFLKNNIKSLQEIRSKTGKRKIDHTLGKNIYWDGGDWELSEMGKFAKDVSDSHCGAIWNCVHNFTDIPRYIWEEKAESKTTKRVDSIKSQIIDEINEKYGFDTSVL